MIHFRILFAFIFSLTTTFTLVEKIQAQNNANPATAAETPSLTTDELLNQVCDFLKSKQSFTVDMDITYDNTLESGSKVQYSAYNQVSVQKPNMLRTNFVGDEAERSFYYNGKFFTLSSPDRNVFSTKEAPATLDELVNVIEEKYGFTIPMSNLFVNNPCSAIEKATEEPLYIGSDFVNRVETDHLLIVTDDWDGQLWISQETPPLIKKVIITYKKLPNFPQYTVLFSNWNFNPSISPDIFEFKPSEDDVQIEMLPPSP
jgi:hypothetical protein